LRTTMSSLLDSALSAGSVVAGFCAFGALLIAHRAWRVSYFVIYFTEVLVLHF
jgi:hypothetical protein